MIVSGEALDTLAVLWAHVAVPAEVPRALSQLEREVPGWRTCPLPTGHRNADGQKAIQRLKAWYRARKLLRDAGRLPAEENSA